ncbi:ABC transporter substrate-binding protein [Candidatus Bipolaricaulota bacterium]|nr:ABC transporter substrate-binding protein [Candidatus Bipolaricaulota bacterium]
MFRKSLVISLALLLVLSGFAMVGLARESHLPKDELIVPIGLEDKDWGLKELSPGLPGGSITYAATSLPKTFNNMVASETSSTDVTGNLMAGLTDTSPSTGRLVPALAKDWDISEDKKTYTFYLREGQKFSDGEPLTADDVIFSFKQLCFNENIEADMRDLLTIDGELPEVEKVDKYTVKFTTPAVFGPFIRTVGGVMIYPKHKLEGISAEEFNSGWGQDVAKENPEEIVGAGPFRLKEYVPEQKVVLERNPYYFMRGPNGVQLPYLEEYTILKVEDTDAQALKFKAHETDVYGPAASKIPMLLKNEEKEGWNVMVKDGPRGAPAGTDFLTFNWDAKKEALAKVFQEKNFRRAVSHAIDRPSIIENVFNGLAVTQDSPMSKLSPYYNEKAGETFPEEYNLDKAKTMLDELGLEDTDDDGVRELPNGEDLSFEMLTNKGNQQRVDIGNTIASDLRNIGIDVTFNPIQFNSLVQQLLGGSYQAVIIGLIGDPIEPNSGNNVWTSKGSLHMWHLDASENPVEWEKRVDEIFNKGLKQIGVDNRRPYYDEWQMIAAEQVPLIYTADQVFLYATENNVQNTERFSPLGAFLGFAEMVWVD